LKFVENGLVDLTGNSKGIYLAKIIVGDEVYIKKMLLLYS
jgi:hypothetical protein